MTPPSAPAAPNPTDPSALRRRIAHSLRWSMASSVGIAGTQLVLTAILARMIDPAAYGAIAVISTLLRWLRYVTDLGLVSVISRRPDLDAADRSLLILTATGANTILALLIWIAAPAAAPLLPGAGAETPMLLRSLCLVLILGSMGDTAAACLQRDLDFRRLGLISWISTAVGLGAVALPLAWAGWGVWALVGNAVGQLGVSLILVLIVIKPSRPAPWPRLRPLLGMGRSFSLLRLLDATFLGITAPAMGLLAGTAAAGYYDRAFVLAVLPMDMLAATVGRVMTPAFSRLNEHGTSSTRRAFLALMTVTPWLVFSIAAGIVAAAPALIAALLGHHWEEAVPVLRLLAIWGAVHALSSLCGSVVEACGPIRWHVAHRAVTVILLAGSLVLVRPHEAEIIMGMALAVEAGSFMFLLSLAAVSTHCSWRDLTRHFGVFAPAAALTLLLTGLSQSLPLPPWPAVTLALLSGTLALVISLWITPSPLLRHALADRILGDILNLGEGPLRRWLRGNKTLDAQD